MNDKTKIFQDLTQLILKILGLETILIVIISLLFGGLNSIPNLFFFSSALLIIVGIYPFWSEAGIRNQSKLSKNGFVLNNNPEELKRKKEERSEKIQRSISFVIVGILSFIISTITAKFV